MSISYAAVAATGLALGWLGGYGYAVIARAWRDYTTQKAQVHGLLTRARLLTIKNITWVMLAVAATGYALYALVVEGG
ncbi:MAG: hypothetical protein ACRDT4_11110 [Micromonosporaceae bacterium]